MQKINIVKILSVGFVLMLVSISTFAQPLPPPATAPVTGGLGALAIISTLFGLRKYFKSRK